LKYHPMIACRIDRSEFQPTVVETGE